MISKIFNTFLVTSLLITGAYASDELQWVASPFWKAPFVKNTDLKLQLTNTELQNACYYYGKMVSDSRSSLTPWQAAKVDRFRKMLLPNSRLEASTFEVFFTPETTLLELKSKVEPDLDHEDLSYPYYLQTESITGASLLNARNIILKISPESQARSYVTYSRSLGLDDSKISVIQNENGLAEIKIDGRDAACDLLEGRASLQIQVPSIVKILPAKMQNLEEFYHQKITPIIIQTNDSKQALSLRAALLGHRLGSAIDEEFRSLTTIENEKALIFIMEKIFNLKSLELNNVVIEVNKKKVIDLKSYIDGNITTINLSM